MHLLKKLAFWTSRGIFESLLIMLAIVGTTVLVLGNGTNIKSVLKSSQVYDKVLKTRLEQAESETEQSTPENTPKDVMFEAARAVLKPATLQNATEQVIDGTYKWLDGTTQLSDIKIDLTTTKEAYINKVVELAEARFNRTPICNKSQLANRTYESEDPFRAACRPPSLTFAGQKPRVTKNINDTLSFLKDPIITTEDLPKNSEGKTTLDQMQDVPKAFQALTVSPIILGFGAVTFGAAMVFLQSSRRRGLRSVGSTLVGCGLLLVVGSKITSSVIKSLTTPSGEIGKHLALNSYREQIIYSINSLTKLIANNILWFGLAYSLIGAAILAILFLTRQNRVNTEVSLKPNKEVPNNHPKTDTN